MGHAINRKPESEEGPQMIEIPLVMSWSSGNVPRQMSNDPAAPSATGLHCLLCGREGLVSVGQLTGDEIRRLWRAANHQLSEEAFGVLGANMPVVLWECCNCGFRFFDPALAGSGKFYEELERVGYYVQSRPEFEFAISLFMKREIQTVMDVGGGEGAFLDRARQLGWQTFGVELNETAAEACARKGHRTFRKRLEDISPEELNRNLDALTLFQVVEHVPDPRAFLTSAARLVKPGGLIVVAVPNENGIFRLLPLDPANMPPHHVSRWRKGDLARLGRACGLELVAMGADILYGSNIQEFWLKHNTLASAIGRRPYPGGTRAPKVISLLYRKLGCRYWLPLRGLSIYAAFRK
jgi:SAM-dependent methyltransferase